MGPRCGRTGRGKDGQGIVVRGVGREGEQEGSGGQGPVWRKERLQGSKAGVLTGEGGGRGYQQWEDRGQEGSGDGLLGLGVVGWDWEAVSGGWEWLAGTRSSW